MNYCHCYFYLHLLNMNDFYVVVKLLEIIIAFFTVFFFFVEKINTCNCLGDEIK